MSVDIAENYWKNDLSKSNKSISVSLVDNIMCNRIQNSKEIAFILI